MEKNQMTPLDLTDEALIGYLTAFNLAAKLNKDEKAAYLQVCKINNLNPFKREIHVSVFGQGENRTLSFITGYETYIKRADASGKLRGWKTKIEGEIPKMSCTITIRKEGWEEPFEHTVYYSECVQTKSDGTPNKFWAKRPKGQLEKVAISQGMRLAFTECSGLPYAEEENITDFVAIEATESHIDYSPIESALKEKKTVDETLAYWETLTDDQRKDQTIKNLFSNRKHEIEAEHPAQTAPPEQPKPEARTIDYDHLKKEFSKMKSVAILQRYFDKTLQQSDRDDPKVIELFNERLNEIKQKKEEPVKTDYAAMQLEFDRCTTENNVSEIAGRLTSDQMKDQKIVDMYNDAMKRLKGVK